jgi:hypothetical protein
MDEPEMDRVDVPVEDDVLDGNALAGPLMAILGIDVSATPGRCAHCGATNVIAQLQAFVRAPGVVLRCPVCHGVIIRLVRTPDATYLDVQGAALLRFGPS